MTAHGHKASATAADPLFRNARREMAVALLVWLVFGFWVVGISWWLGWGEVASANAVALETPTVLGMPRWVFWGVALPWMAANVFTFWFCFRFMTDDALESVPEEQPESAASKDAGGLDHG